MFSIRRALVVALVAFPVFAGAVLAETPGPAAKPAVGECPWIKNPVHPRAVWKLWFEEPTPMHYAAPTLGDPKMRAKDFAPPDPKKRLYPDLAAKTSFPAPFLLLTDRSQGAAGFWDDAYATLDGAHSLIPTSWGDDFGNSINLAAGFIRVDIGAPDFVTRMRLGINFTSQSLSEHGHQLIDHWARFDQTEREFFFANTVRGTPAYLSFREILGDRVIDSYDALFAQSFQSVGRSGSESGALLKMLIAGGYLPRPIKDLLKRHGAYAATLLTIFRATLPYADENGEVPFANELRHRVAYVSNGNRCPQEFAPLNRVYHGYDDSLHLFRMIEMARGMKGAPPVAVMSLEGFEVTKDGKVVSKHANDALHLEPEAEDDPRIKSVHKTMIRIWGQPGETIAVRVDLRASYDLQGLPLTFEAHGVYPEQRNITIEPDKEAGIFRISVRHDPKLPKGRVPVLLVARNAQQASNPVFVNFYWPEPDQPEKPGYYQPPSKGAGGTPKVEVTRNLRPTMSASLPGGAAWCEPGKSVSFAIESRDPEGFPVRLYRWSSDAGTLKGNTFSFSATPVDAGKVFPLHFIASDGTGGYNSLMARLVVGKPDVALPPGWTGSVLGVPQVAGSARLDGDRLELVAAGRGIGGEEDEGHAAWFQAEGDLDLAAQLVDLCGEGSSAPGQAKAGLIVREDDGLGARELFVGAQGNSKSGRPLAGVCLFRQQTGGWSISKSGAPELGQKPGFLRVIRRGNWLAACQSADGKQWEQVFASASDVPKRVLAGVAIGSGEGRRLGEVQKARAVCRVPATPPRSLPLIQFKGKVVDAGAAKFQGPVEVTLLPPAGDCQIRCTLDQSEPTKDSTLYEKPLNLAEARQYVIKARAFWGNEGGETVAAVVQSVK